MALDTKYRPIAYDDVIGQDATVRVLKEFVRRGAGFHQSYLFCGFHGSGKTTLGRILARALLCEAPQDGEPCNRCLSCETILRTGASECFRELDAATNSSKEDILAITEMVAYDTLSGKRRVYLIDEAHRLSTQALDALLKPTEDVVEGTQDKRLICIFCTTEPEKMKDTIRSRCAPAFVIRHVTPARVADRLAEVCRLEGIVFEHEALVLIAEAVECHLRDALKAVEGVSMSGPITMGSVGEYLRLNANGYLMEIVTDLGNDLPQVIRLTSEIADMVSPAVAYERLAEICLLAYRTTLGITKALSFWSAERLQAIGQRHGDHLLRFAEVFAGRPLQATYAMLECDLAMLHHQRAGTWSTLMPSSVPIQVAVTQVPAPPVSSNAVQRFGPSTDPISHTPVPAAPPTVDPAPVAASQRTAGTVGTASPEVSATPFLTPGKVYLDPRSMKKRDGGNESPGQNHQQQAMEPAMFRDIVRRHVDELLDGRRSAGSS